MSYVTIADPSADWLLGLDRNDTSQFGEDGLIEAVLGRIGETNRWCFEVGAADGLFFSNTKRLRDAGWNCVLIEPQQQLWEQCKQFESERVIVVNEAIGPHNPLDDVLLRSGCPTVPDFGVIDIDGQDYWAWLRLEKIRPRIMLVEFNYAPTHMIPFEGSGAGQAGLEVITNLGNDKGYVALATTYCNVLFVDREVWQSQNQSA